MPLSFNSKKHKYLRILFHFILFYFYFSYLLSSQKKNYFQKESDFRSQLFQRNKILIVLKSIHVEYNQRYCNKLLSVYRGNCSNDLKENLPTRKRISLARISGRISESIFFAVESMSAWEPS